MSNPSTLCYIEKDITPASTQEMLLAARNLTGAAFKLFIYLNTFIEPKFLYERVEAGKILNTDRNTLNRAFNDLCTTNYLVRRGEKIYDFFTHPVQNIQEHG